MAALLRIRLLEKKILDLYFSNLNFNLHEIIINAVIIYSCIFFADLQLILNINKY
jgi:hypothetical protein